MSRLNLQIDTVIMSIIAVMGVANKTIDSI